MFAVLCMTLLVLAPGLGLLRQYTVDLIERMVAFGLS
jgi:hypothetical protein